MRKIFGLLAAGLLAALVPAEVTLRYACADNGDSLAVADAVVRAFEKAHPGIRVKVEPAVGGTVYEQKLLATVAAGIEPDVARLTAEGFLPLAAHGALLPLDDLVARDRTLRLDEYSPVAVASFRSGGSLYELPMAVGSNGVVYLNKRRFREAGVPLPGPDWTWTEKPRPALRERDFTWLMGRLSADGPPRRYAMASGWPQLWLYTLLDSKGLSLWDDDASPTRMAAADPAVVALAGFAVDCVRRRRWLPSQNELSSQNTSVGDQFVAGNVAMYLSGNWEMLRFRRDIKDFDWDVLPFPSYAGRPRRTTGGATGVAILARTRHPREAWELAKWMAGPPGETAYARAGLDMPAIRSLALAPGVWLPSDPSVPPRHARYTVDAADAMVVHAVPEWFRPIQDKAQGQVYGVLNTPKPVAETLARLQADGDRDIDFALRRRSRPPYPAAPAVALAALLVAAGLYWVYGRELRTARTRRQRLRDRAAYGFLLPWLLGIGLTLGPMLYSLFLSFAESDIVRPPRWAGVSNYVDAFTAGDDVLVSLRQTFLYAGLSIPIGTAVALGLALLLNQPVRGVPLFRALYYLPSLASGVAMSLVWLRIFNPDSGLLNVMIYGADGKGDLLGLGHLLSALAGTPGHPVQWLNNVRTVVPALVLTGAWGAGGGTIIFLAGLQGISPTYYEAATIDGAGALRRFRSITLPLLSPTIFFSLVTGAIGAMQVFTPSVVMTQGGEPDRATLFYMVHLYDQAFNRLKMGYASALAWILFLIILAITALQLWGARRWVHYEGEGA